MFLAEIRQLLIALLCGTLFCASGFQPCLADTLSGKCVKILDGDTIEVLCANTPFRVRLDGIDCPEKRQAFGQQAKNFTGALVFRKDVEVSWKKKDRYGRLLGTVKLSDGRILNDELVRSGYAWWYRKYSNDRRLAALELSARNQRAGLWSTDAAIAPWDFRHMEKTPITALERR